MSDCLSRDQLIHALCDNCTLRTAGSDNCRNGCPAYNFLASAPPVDAVPVVRCRDCKYFTERYNNAYRGHYCERIVEFVQKEDFCSKGERNSLCTAMLEGRE